MKWKKRILCLISVLAAMRGTGGEGDDLSQSGATIRLRRVKNF
jgi:hypothetical protein